MHIFGRIIVSVFCARMVYPDLSQYGQSLGSICVHACFAYTDDHINPLYEWYFLLLIGLILFYLGSPGLSPAPYFRHFYKGAVIIYGWGGCIIQ